MVQSLYRVASRVATLNTFLRHVERRVYLNTFHKARSNSTVAWPPPNLLRNYNKFQIHDGTPIYLKGGAMDRVLFGATVTMVALGLLDGFYNLLTMAFPKKKN